MAVDTECFEVPGDRRSAGFAVMDVEQTGGAAPLTAPACIPHGRAAGPVPPLESRTGGTWRTMSGG